MWSHRKIVFCSFYSLWHFSLLFLLSYSQTYSPSLSLWQCLTPYLTAWLSQSHFLLIPISLSAYTSDTISALPLTITAWLKHKVRTATKKHTHAHKVKRYDSSFMVLGFDMSCLLSTPVFFLTSLQWTILCCTGCYRFYLILLFSGKNQKQHACIECNEQRLYR